MCSNDFMYLRVVLLCEYNACIDDNIMVTKDSSHAQLGISS